MRTITLILLLVATSFGQNSVTAGRLHSDPPKLENLGFSWSIAGDANRNCAVQVEYKPSAEAAWRQALPLLRIGGEQIGRDREKLKYIIPEGFAGSILNLQPGTEYDVRLTLSDADGVSGERIRAVKLRTRSEPQPYSGGRTLRHRQQHQLPIAGRF